MGPHIDVHIGLVVLVSRPYDEVIVAWIRTLPGRRYRRHDREWIVPARREHLRPICGLIGELEERDIDVDVSPAARARLSRADIGRAMLRGSAIEIAGPYSKNRLPALRALPERGFDAERRVWAMPLTRAGALAVLALERSDELTLTQRATDALRRSATPTAAESIAPDEGGLARPTRRSPIAHWRHFTTGPVFDNPSRQRIDIPGIGRCVRVRVNPRHRPEQPGAREHAADRTTPDATAAADGASWR